MTPSWLLLMDPKKEEMSFPPAEDVKKGHSYSKNGSFPPQIGSAAKGH